MPKTNLHHPIQPRRRTTSDPLAAALLPPPDESPVERELRLKAEIDAKRVSDSIDEMLHQERAERKKSKTEVNVLLLGQSESGKSTTLKQFQLLHSPSAFHAERIAWRAVIYLNLVRSIRRYVSERLDDVTEALKRSRILDALSPETDNFDDHDDGDSLETASVIISSSGRPASALVGTQVPNYEVYRRKLEPLVDLEERLILLLSSPDEDEATHLGPARPEWKHYANIQPVLNNSGSGAQNGRPTPTITIPLKLQTSFSINKSNASNTQNKPSSDSSALGYKGKEIAVHTSNNWKKAFSLGKSPKSAHSGEIEGWWEDPDDPVHILNACAPAMLELWRDAAVKKRLQEKRLRLEESSGFYLDEIPRITAKKYFPTNADVLKARLKTVGVVEHTFSVPSGSNRGLEWRIYDVGGSRNQRQAWAPYFEDVNAIIFLAPISVFDQTLAEDPRVNRLEDSLLLFKSLVSNKLLANVSIVLFLNKCDLLKDKLKAGIRLKRHMPGYGDRPNDYQTVSQYFRMKFSVLHTTYTPNKEREIYTHYTAVTDTTSTSAIISAVRDIIIKGNLRTMRLV